MRYTRYIVGFATALLLLILSRPTVEQYIQQLDRNQYVNQYTKNPVKDTGSSNVQTTINNSGTVTDTGSTSGFIELENTGNPESN